MRPASLTTERRASDEIIKQLIAAAHNLATLLIGAALTEAAAVIAMVKLTSLAAALRAAKNARRCVRMYDHPAPPPSRKAKRCRFKRCARVVAAIGPVRPRQRLRSRAT